MNNHSESAFHGECSERGSGLRVKIRCSSRSDKFSIFLISCKLSIQVNDLGTLEYSYKFFGVCKRCGCTLSFLIIVSFKRNSLLMLLIFLYLNVSFTLLKCDQCYEMVQRCPCNYNLPKVTCIVDVTSSITVPKFRSWNQSQNVYSCCQIKENRIIIGPITMKNFKLYP